jgi:hypothetical protein
VLASAALFISCSGAFAGVCCHLCSGAIKKPMALCELGELLCCCSAGSFPFCYKWLVKADSSP